MSHILESHLDAERRCQCERNDQCLASGQPIVGDDTPPQRAARPSMRTIRMYAAMAVVKMCLCCAAIGFGIGHLVATTSRPPMDKVQLDKRDLHKVPSDKSRPIIPKVMV